MSCSLYVTRASTFHQSESSPITHEEWKNLVAADESLSIEEGSNYDFAVWSNPHDLEGYYELQWFEGAISADITSNHVIRKLLEVAEVFEAGLLDDGDKRYVDDSGYPVDYNSIHGRSSRA